MRENIYYSAKGSSGDVCMEIGLNKLSRKAQIGLVRWSNQLGSSVSSIASGVKELHFDRISTVDRLEKLAPPKRATVGQNWHGKLHELSASNEAVCSFNKNSSGGSIGMKMLPRNGFDKVRHGQKVGLSIRSKEELDSDV